MYLDRTYHPRRRRRGIMRFWPLMLLAILGIILYEQQPDWLVNRMPEPTVIPTRSAVSFLADADIAYRSGNISGAIAAYQEVMRLEPTNPKPLAALSALKLILKDLDESYLLAQQALELAPRDVEVLNAAARIENWRGDNEIAIQHAFDAQELEPQNATTLAILAEIYTDEGNRDFAQEYLDQALALEPDNVMALRNQAYLYEIQGDYENAIASYEAAIAVAPYRFDLYIEKGRQYRVGLLDFEAANAAYRQAVEAYEAPVTLDALGDGLYNAGNNLGAVETLRRAVDLDPEYGPALVHLGMAYYARRNYEDAVTNLEKGLAIIGDSARIEQVYTAGLAHIYKAPSECDKAEPWLRRALAMHPDATPASEGLRLCNLPVGPTTDSD
jgi:tetratricopeptide (TPR) repeat protein